MSAIGNFYRSASALCLVLYAAFCVVFMATVPIRDAEGVAIDAGGIGPVISAQAFLWAQAALIVGIVGVAHALRGRATVLSAIAAGMILIGAVGHAASAGFAFVETAATTDAARDTVTAAVNGPAFPAIAIAMVGTVVGSVILAIALFRAGRSTWWVAGVLLGWVITEFFLSSMGTWAAILSGALLIAAFGGLAWNVLRSDPRQWTTALEAVRERESAATLA